MRISGIKPSRSGGCAVEAKPEGGYGGSLPVVRPAVTGVRSQEGKDVRGKARRGEDVRRES